MSFPKAILIKRTDPRHSAGRFIKPSDLSPDWTRCNPGPINLAAITAPICETARIRASLVDFYRKERH